MGRRLADRSGNRHRDARNDVGRDDGQAAGVYGRRHGAGPGCGTSTRTAPATGTSALVTTPAAVGGVTPFTTVTFTVTANPGSDRYRLQLLPGSANVPVAGIAAGV
jgi:hypothetical protein